MAIRFGQFLHIGSNDFLIERLQTVGPDALNIPTERIREVGNYQSVATIRDTPDLSFAINSYSATVELEEYLLGATLDKNDGNDLKTIKPVSIVTQLKPGENAEKPFTIAGSVVFPSLLAERVSYRFATGENSTMDVTLRGDSVYYNPGAVGFIDSARISASTYIYGFEYTNLKNGAGTGLNLKSVRVNILPQLLAGSIAIKKVPKLKLIYGTLTRGRSNVRFTQENENEYEVINGSPNTEYYKARVEFVNNSVEQWAGLGLAYKIDKHWSIGLSAFGAYTHIEVRSTQNVNTDAVFNGAPYTTTVNE